MGLVFDWSQTHVDADIDVPRDPISLQLRINWDQYQIWDLVNLTQNYLKLILRYLTDSSSGILIHCISGKIFCNLLKHTVINFSIFSFFYATKQQFLFFFQKLI